MLLALDLSGGLTASVALQPPAPSGPPRARSVLAAEQPFGGATRGLSDGGPVIAVHGRFSLVYGHPSSRPVLQQIATEVDAAVPRVTAVWGPGWPRRVVVLVPSSQAELARIVGGQGDYSQIAAVETAELAVGSRPGDDRVIVNPVNYARLDELGRHVVLTHEVTHVATRDATGAATPAWLVEGFADYVGYLGVHAPLDLSAAELRSAVRAGHLPAALPTDSAFDGTNADLAQSYEQAWLAVSLLARRHGQAALVRFYRAVGAGTPVDRALRELFGTSTAAFTASWRADLLARLG